MPSNTKAINDILAKLSDEINQKAPKAKAELLQKFVKQFYGTTSLEDLQSHSISNLYGALMSFWQFMIERTPQQPKVRVYNPDYEQHGFQSGHTIVEISTEDMPFLVDSVIMAINYFGSTVHLIVHTGDMEIIRDKSCQIKDILDFGIKNVKLQKDHCQCREAAIYIEIDKQTDSDVLNEIKDKIESVLDDIKCAVADWQDMREKVLESIEGLENIKDQLQEPSLPESIGFLKWITNNHFTFIGIRDYELVEEKGEKVLTVIPDSGFGVMRESSESKVSRRLATMTPEAQELTLSSQVLIISKTNTLSSIHRPIYTDYIGIKRFDGSGNVCGERRVIGLYTSIAYNTSTLDIPLMRQKVKSVMNASNLSQASHAGKVLLNILDTLPRDDFFQATNEELSDLAMGIFHLQERKRIRLFVRKDIYGRFVSCLVFVPRERFNTDLRERIQVILMSQLGGTDVSFTTHFSESVLARIHFTVRVDKAKSLVIDEHALEQKLVDVGKSWHDNLKEYLVDQFGEEKGNVMYSNYMHSFPGSYIEFFSPRTAIYDLSHIDKLTDDNQLEMNFFRPADEESNVIRFKVFQLNHTIPLSDVLPILENMGLRVISERPFEFNLSKHRTAWLNDFGMVYTDNPKINLDSVKGVFQDAFKFIWLKCAENDGFNKLIIGAGLSWREASVLRAIAKYLQQTGFTFSQAYIEDTFQKHTHIATLLIELFSLKFDPEVKRDDKKIEELQKNILGALDDVQNLDEDRIIRRYLDVLKGVLRTNYYCHQEMPRDYISFKLNPKVIPGIPRPLPEFEIFVYSPSFEGVHLRGAKVARGGLRWSDRREDFRTEVLGLMRAQVVKNAVIVPSGAKGGFVPKLLPVNGTREEIQKEGIACYQNFIRGLLDLTDNIVNGKIVPPQNVVRYDEDDPYLVVAADKGTATFSDIANTIAHEYGFWLDDAFASGGSTGYDHKKMGITARGAWESIKRHFREFDINIQQQDFTVIGIGDMSGDVFGNGLLLSKHTKLVGAFNHIHIFLDPSPDAKKSFTERKRLFDLPRSSWEDYDASLISSGGGVFKRSEKSIRLSSEIKRVLKIHEESLEPNDLIRYMLKAPVDLLFNGGIGTYIKSGRETHQDVGDRANDCVRVDASQLKARVIGEGGNLGVTQLGRVDFSIGGGYVYTDFIDNAGGVDCSDHEVNIKILLNTIVKNGDLTEKQRNNLLSEMTEEVADLVLKSNYRQTQAISLAADHAIKNVQLHSRFLDELENSGRIDRSFEFLPDEKMLMERKKEGKGLLRPGLAILLSYSKTLLKEQILDSDVPEDPFYFNMLSRAFPMRLTEKYSSEMQEHRLKREIIATQLSNDLVNSMGFTFVYRLQDETGAPVSAIVRAYSAASQIFQLDKIWQGVEALDNKVPTKVQNELILTVIRLIRRATRWFLRNRRQSFEINEITSYFTKGVLEVQRLLPNYLIGVDKENYDENLSHYNRVNVPEELSVQLASSSWLQSALDMVEAATENNLPLEQLVDVYYRVGDELSLGWFRNKVIIHVVNNHWEALTREAIRDDIDLQQKLISISLLQHNFKVDSMADAVKLWCERYSALVLRWQSILDDMTAASTLNFTMYFVAIRELLDLTQTSIQAVVTNGNGKTVTAKANPPEAKPVKTKKTVSLQKGKKGQKAS